MVYIKDILTGVYKTPLKNLNSKFYMKICLFNKLEFEVFDFLKS